MIKILIADDSPVAREVLKDWLSREKDLQLVGAAENGEEAFQMTKSLAPNLVIMDIMMPKMNGIEAVEKIMAYCPTPVLIFSSVLNDKRTEVSFEAISRGALDVLAKPGDDNLKSENEVREELIKKVRLLSRIPVIPHPLAKLRARKQEGRSKKPASAELSLSQSRYKILGIGASTGGPKAICEIIRAFPGDFPAPVVIVQHIADAFLEGLARWLTRESELSVKIPQAGEVLKEGVAYLGPANQHMLVKDGIVELGNDAPVNNCRPSIDVLFHSLAENYGSKTVAVLLTGMGSDGAQGMKEIHQKGGRTIAQDESTSIVFGMPASAIKLKAADEIEPLDKIPEAIFNAFGIRQERSKK